MTRWVSAVFLYANVAIGCVWVQWKNTGGLKQKHKKQPFSDASASHLSLVLWHVWFQANHINHKPKGRFFWYAFGIYKPKEPSLWFVISSRSLNQPHHTTNAALPSEGGGIAKRIKNRSPSAKNPVGTWYFTSAHNCYTILIINYLSWTRSIESTEKL